MHDIVPEQENISMKYKIAKNLGFVLPVIFDVIVGVGAMQSPEL